ncbi:sodium-dependent phosphate transport protein 2B-like [Anneissia japonica]|uniref:sodium-dependent phosphate transport protein 2B-like n=1 Tax=Anneissia japonica TaxID=1529436 RepID=UPI0014255890|nr:sodium-dependent phosphate transport protein 2B-like [Anneissia japonica]
MPVHRPKSEDEQNLVKNGGTPMKNGHSKSVVVPMEQLNGGEKLEQETDTAVAEESYVDPWTVAEIANTSIPWSELDTKGKVKRVILWILKPIMIVTLLYFFICSLDIMSSAFRLLGGKAAGEALSHNELLNNPVCGLMLGILVTVLVQSSSTSTSITVSMVAAGLLQVQPAIFIIMGANIGTSVTNTIVSLAQSGDRNEFRRAFGGATVHDMFNWLAVSILLPLEVITGYLYRLTNLIVKSFNIHTHENAKIELLKVLTKPFTKKIVQVDTKVISKISTGQVDADHSSLLKVWCKKAEVAVISNLTEPASFTETRYDANGTLVDSTYEVNITRSETEYEKVGVEKCSYLFADTGLSEKAVGAILLCVSLLMLCVCLVILVKTLNSILQGKLASVIKNTLNADFPGRLSFLTGYFAILVGAAMTFIVQSSSVFTSAMTPLVGMGVITLERMYPLTLGSNIGTTATGLLAALASTGGNFSNSLQIALCHLLFNISAILIWYPVPFMRRMPVYLAKLLGNTTADYRWFAIFYLIIMFFVLPGFVFLLSLAGTGAFIGVGLPLLLIFVLIVIINIMQEKCPQCLPAKLQDWEFLPLFLRSLDPIDAILSRLFAMCHVCRCFTGDYVAKIAKPPISYRHSTCRVDYKSATNKAYLTLPSKKGARPPHKRTRTM